MQVTYNIPIPTITTPVNSAEVRNCRLRSRKFNYYDQPRGPKSLSIFAEIRASEEGSV